MSNPLDAIEDVRNKINVNPFTKYFHIMNIKAVRPADKGMSEFYCQERNYSFTALIFVTPFGLLEGILKDNNGKEPDKYILGFKEENDFVGFMSFPMTDSYLSNYFAIINDESKYVGDWIHCGGRLHDCGKTVIEFTKKGIDEKLTYDEFEKNLEDWKSKATPYIRGLINALKANQKVIEYGYKNRRVLTDFIDMNLTYYDGEMLGIYKEFKKTL